MFYLYLKKHNVTGLKYLGYTKNDPEKYRGSGLYWKKHISEHGYNVETTVLFASENIEDISRVGQHYSKLWNVVNDKQFANLTEEDGNKLFGKANINFRGHPQTLETRQKIAENHSRNMLGKFGQDHPAYGHKVPSIVFENVNTMILKNRLEGPWNKGKKGVQKVSEETKKKMSVSANRNPKQKVTCPICNKSGGKPAMMRYHFDNCKGNK
jgi:hypothetical protein